MLSTEMISLLAGIFVAPLLTAIGALFWQLAGIWKARYQDARSDNDKLQEVIDSYRKESIPAMASLQDSLRRLADLVEKLDRRLERLEDRIGR